MTGVSADLVDKGDLDELIRHVDRLRDAGAWDDLVDLRDRARAAHERGRQLWPVASLCEYRVTLLAPGEFAGPMLRDGAGQFAPGPLPEIAASTHAWEELEPHLADGPIRALVAHERAVRGDDLRGVELENPVLDLPLAREAWEPSYAVATYDDEGVSVESPSLPEHHACDLPDAPDTHDDGVVTDALLELVRPWTSASNGTALAVAVEATAEAAMAAAGADRPRAATLQPADALGYLAWTGSSGGAHGRRRGAAAGRFNAWWAAAALTGLEEPWPPGPTELGEAISELRWLHWTEPGETGWCCRLAVEDPADGLAWAVSATDATEST